MAASTQQAAASYAARALSRFKERAGGAVFSAPLPLYSQSWKEGALDRRFATPSTHRGPSDAPHYSRGLVIAHGLMGTTNNFFTPGTQISRKLAHCIDGVCALDKRNHGRSPHHDVHSSVVLALDLLHHVGRMAEAAAEAEPGVEPRYVIMGHSMGGTAVATALTLVHDKDARNLLLEEARAAGMDADAERRVGNVIDNFDDIVPGAVVVDVCPSQRMPSAFHRISSDLQALIDLEMHPGLGPKEASAQLKERIPNDMMRNFLVTNLVSGRTRDSTPSSWRCNLPVLRDALPKLAFPFEEEPPRDSAVRTPTLWVFGDRSEYNHAEGRAAIDRFFSGAEQVDVKDSGHYPHFEQRDQFCAAVEPFIERCIEGK